VSPSRRPASISVWRTHYLTAVSVRSISRATARRHPGASFLVRTGTLAVRDIVATLAAADPANKAAVYRELGISRTYNEDGQVRVEARPRVVATEDDQTRLDAEVFAGPCLRGPHGAGRAGPRPTREQGLLAGRRRWVANRRIPCLQPHLPR
jgi:hypothetical protein